MMYPGYVNTQLSINAQVGKPGESFGKTDSNIANGMSADQAAKEMLIASYLDYNEYICTSKAWHRVVLPVRNLWNWFEEFAVCLDFKN